MRLSRIALGTVLGAAVLAGGFLVGRALGFWGGATVADPKSIAAEAILHARAPRSLEGTARFSETPDGIRIAVSIENATPGSHGIHVHSIGDCSAPDFATAGGHFAPEGHPHGGPDAARHHAGDLGNIDVEASGRGSLTLTTDALTLKRGGHSVLDRAVVIHAKPDDLASQPSGNSGERIACGVVRAVEESG
jgi:Cu-Zn family superoxide dismutase